MKNSIITDYLREEIKNIESLESSFSLLIVDDSMDTINLILEILKPYKIFNDCNFACNGIDGLQAFKDFKQNIIISDIHMPELNGIEMAKQIRILNKTVPIIFVSCEDDLKVLQEALIVANFFIKKPITSNNLFEKLVPALNNCYWQKELDVLQLNIEKDSIESIKRLIKVLRLEIVNVNKRINNVHNLISKFIIREEDC